MPTLLKEGQESQCGWTRETGGEKVHDEPEMCSSEGCVERERTFALCWDEKSLTLSAE